MNQDSIDDDIENTIETIGTVMTDIHDQIENLKHNDNNDSSNIGDDEINIDDSYDIFETNDEECEYIYSLIESLYNEKYDKKFLHQFKEKVIVPEIYEITLYNLKYENIIDMIEVYEQLNNITPYVNKHSNERLELTAHIDSVIQKLTEKNTNAQKSDTWYEMRKNRLTASSLWKIFKSESTRNSIIYEKCKMENKKPQYYGGPMEWGNKYEPVSVMVYEDMYNTKVGDFGCIEHDNYSFIGASPDGINIEPSSPLYGRMLEIKNIVNRDITGIPKEEYWVQMQTQMEVCELQYCDFFETRFKEYSIDDFYMDEIHKYKGIVLYFSKLIKLPDDPDSYKPHYEYFPLKNNYTREDVDEWIITTEEKLKDTYILYNKYYYYLEEWSCVLIEQNKKWFEAVRHQIVDTWDTILKERETGYEHRAAKSRSNSLTNNDKNTTTVSVTNNINNDSKIIHNLDTTPHIVTIKLD